MEVVSIGRSKINYRKVEFDGHVFDSTSEYQFYLELKFRKQEMGIKDIIIQPLYTLVPEHRVKCWKCDGSGKTVSEKSGRPVKCSRRVCDNGLVTKEAVTYNADFKLIYEDGREQVIDVKGYRGQDKKFNLKKRLFEAQQGVELILVISTPKGWKWQT